MWPFQKKHPIVVGELWEFKQGSDPFPSEYPPVQIIGYKDGWVRYKIDNMFSDERKREFWFRLLYRPYQKDSA